MIEVLMAGVLVAGLLVLAAVVSLSAGDAARFDSAQLDTDRAVSVAMGRITSLLEESAVDLLHSGEREWNAASGVWTQSSAFSDPMAGLGDDAARVCANPACSWSRDESGNWITPNAYLASSYASSSALPEGVESFSGRPVLAEVRGECPRCGVPLSSAVGGEVDGLWFLSPRDAGNAFVRDEGPDDKPDWQAMVFLLPVPARGSRPGQLRRYVLYRNDFLDPGKIVDEEVSASWTKWDTYEPTGVPTFHDLLDMDGDGRIEPVIHQSDATSESLRLVGTDLEFEKRFLSGSTHRWFRLEIDRETGATRALVDQSDPNGSRWYRQLSFVRRPAVVAANLLDWEVSTVSDDAYDALRNPLGVQALSSVRVTLLVEELDSGRGGVRHRQSVLGTTISPRN